LKERPAVVRALREEQRRLGAHLRRLREDRTLTQEQAAEAIGIHAKHLQRLESGSANATLATLVATSLAYRVPIRSLFEEKQSAGAAQPFRQGRVVLVQHSAIHDPEHGGRYTVKIYESKKRREDDSWRTVEVRLKPDTDARGHRPIMLRGVDESEIRVIAELVEVLPWA
jgi:transcriptional regulator with XRE-family HTH domain